MRTVRAKFKDMIWVRARIRVRVRLRARSRFRVWVRVLVGARDQVAG